MAKIKKAFFCTSCGHESPKWLGKCPSCQEWNTFKEELVSKPSEHPSQISGAKKTPELIQDVKTENLRRIELVDKELNRVLGGGLVPGSLVLCGGEPGIGKSTLMLQFAIRDIPAKILYVSGEESNVQLSMRAHRIGIVNEACFIVAENDLNHIFNHIRNIQPRIVIIDSIQTVYSPELESAPGSVSQVTTCTVQLMRFAKSTNTPVILIGHITKEGSLAGPKVMEHMVDTVLQFEGDRNFVFRLLRTVKNRFGATNELGVYEMNATGLIGVENPSGVLISANRYDRSGIAIATIMEGIRPVLVEVQALVSSAVYGTPQRSATGIEAKRLNMILAVLEKRAGFRLATKDVFVNLTGGIKVDDPALDLAIAIAILSSSEDIPVPEDVCFAGEIGLSGEVRPVSRIDQRKNEAHKMSFKRLFISAFTQNANEKSSGIELKRVKSLEDVISVLFG